jgi:hypothetical protein
MWRPGCPRPTRRRFLDGLTDFQGLIALTANSGSAVLPTLSWDTMRYLLAGGDWVWDNRI